MKTVKYFIEHFDESGVYLRTECEAVDGKRRVTLYNDNLNASRREPNSPEFLKHHGVQLVRETLEREVQSFA